jgi:RIP metalloprotease RseP
LKSFSHSFFFSFCRIDGVWTGYPVALSDSRNAIAAQQSISKLISVIRETPEGGAVQLSVIRSPALLPSSTIPPKPVSVKVQPKPVEGNRGPQSIGVMLSPNFVKTSRLHADSWIEAAQLAAKYVGEITSETTSGLVSLFSQVVKGQGAPAGQQISGPIGLIRTGSEVVATKDWNSVVIFATIISINLAVINSLPLPALDGGQLVFVLAEAFTGRKVDQRLQETITSVAFLVLLLATASFAIGDVQNLLGR